MDTSQTLTIAAEIQRSLLPESCPRLSHFDLAAVSVPADKVGGDFYDFIELGKDRLGILIGDATGHGLSAAIFMAAAKSQLLREAKRSESPAVAMTATHNRIVNFFASQAKFTTVIYGVLFQRDHRFTVTTAGMMPYWVKSERAECIGLQSPGMSLPLGIQLMEGEYKNQEIGLAPEDILVFYSDGLTEAQNRQEELFGYERLEDLLLSHRTDTAFGIVDTLISTVTDFTNSAPLDDDLTIVVLKAARPSDEPTTAARTTIVGERKPVAVMICHLIDESGKGARGQVSSVSAGSSLWDKVLLSTLHDTYGGVFELLTESTLVGLFGVPVTYEDNAQRALAAAWELKAQLAEAKLAMHAGIHTGTVTFRPDAAIDYSLMGETFNLALQLSHHAPPGHILLSERTHQLARSAFEVETTDILDVDLGTVLTVKRPAFIQQHQLRETALVGRTSEWASLRQCLNRLTEGAREGHIVHIIGEAGIGKSRLVAEMHREAENLGFSWAHGSCRAYGKTGYGVVRELLQDIFQIHPGMEQTAILKRLQEGVRALVKDKEITVLPYIAHLFAIELPAELAAKVIHLDPQALQLATFLAMRSLLVAMTHENALVLVVEDIHWIDDASAEMLSFLLQFLRNIPILFVWVSRPLSEEHAAVSPDFLDCPDEISLLRTSQLLVTAELIDSANTMDSFTTISLEPLSANDSAILVSHLLEGGQLSKSVIRSIRAQAGGNPFYLSEFVRTLREQGLLKKQDNQWELLEQQRLTVPETIEGLVLARVDRLDATTKQIVQTAAVIGQTVYVPLLKTIVESNSIESHFDLRKGIGTLHRRGFLHQTASQEFHFVHALTQEAIYHSLLTTQREILHERIGAAMEHLFYENLSAHYGQLAYHYQHSRNDQKAVEYLHKAADQAKEQDANANAVEFYSQGLLRLEQILESEETLTFQFEMLSGRQDVLNLIGQRDQQAGDLLEMERLAQALSSEQKLATTYRKRSVFDVRTSQYDAAKKHAQQALEYSRAVGDQEEEANSLNTLGIIYNDSGDYSMAERCCQRALDIFRDIGNRGREAHTLNNLGNVYKNWGKYPVAKQFQQQALSIYCDIGARRGEAGALNNLAIIYFNFGDYFVAEQLYQRALDIYREIGYRLGEASCLANLGEIHRIFGDYTVSERFYQQALGIWRDIGNQRGEAHTLDSLGVVYESWGKYSAAEHFHQQALNIYREIGARHGESESLYHLGEVALCRIIGTDISATERNFSDAHSYFDAAYEIAHQLNATPLEIQILSARSIVLLQLKDFAASLSDSRRSMELLSVQRHAEEIQYMYFRHYTVLSGCLDAGILPDNPSTQQEIATTLQKAYQTLMEQADKIPDEATRQSFLQNNPRNRNIIDSYKREGAFIQSK